MSVAKLNRSKKVLKTAENETGNGTGDFILKTKYAKTIEIWVDVTAITSSPTLVVTLESSNNSFTTQIDVGSISGITGISVNSANFNAADHPLGEEVQVTWTLSGGTANFGVDAIIGE